MFRALVQEDEKEFIAMVEEFYRSKAVLESIPKEHMTHTFQEIVSGSPYVKAYFIEMQGEVAGYGLISLTYSNEVGGLVVWVEELYIKERYRGLGFAGKFLDFIRFHFSPKAKRFRLEVSEANKSVQELYMYKGYKTLKYIQMVQDIKDF